jgi:hypothetical protein
MAKHLRLSTRGKLPSSETKIARMPVNVNKLHAASEQIVLDDGLAHKSHLLQVETERLVEAALRRLAFGDLKPSPFAQ